MTDKEHRKFIKELIANVQAKILQRRYPKEWDGIELRWLVSEHFQQVVFGGYKDKRQKRYKDFENTCIVDNLF